MMPRMILDLLFGWWNWLGIHSSDVHNLVNLCLMWMVWQECNRHMFEDLKSSRTQLLAMFSSRLFHWEMEEIIK